MPDNLEDPRNKKPEPFGKEVSLPSGEKPVPVSAIKTGFDAGELGKKWSEFFKKEEPKTQKGSETATLGVRG